MNKKNEESIKAAFWYIIANLTSKVMVYICTPLYIRLLTKSEYGQYSNFLSYQSILISLLALDLGATVSIAFLDYSNERDFCDYINTITILSYITPVIFCSIILVFSRFFSDVFNIKAEYLPVLVMYIVLSNPINIFQAEQRIRIRYKKSTILTLATTIATISTTICFGLIIKDKLFGILLGGILPNALVGAAIALKNWKRSKLVKNEYVKYSLKIAIPIIPHALAGTILLSSDKIMITNYCGEEKTALYNLAFVISMVVTAIASSMNKAWVPWFFEQLRNNNLEDILKISKRIMGAVSMGAIFLCFIAPEISLIIGGKGYLESSFVMPPIIVSCVINCIATFYINIEFYNKKTIGISIATVLSAVINLIMNYYLINRFGYIAAAYTTLFSSLVTFVLHILIVKKQGMLQVFDNRFSYTLIVIIIFATPVVLLTYSILWLRVLLLICYVVLGMGLMIKNRTLILQLINLIKRFWE